MVQTRMAKRSATKPRPPRRWDHDSARVISSREGQARIAVISDTHSQAHAQSVELVSAREPDAILHAGDVGDLSVLTPFRAIAPLIVVRGNIDARAELLPDSVDVQVFDAREQQLGSLLLQHICVYGPKLRADAAKNAQAHGAQIVVCGHSHVPFIGRDRGLWVFNPGSIGPRRFALPIVFGVMELSPGRVNLTHIDCETGDRWTPQGAASIGGTRNSV